MIRIESLKEGDRIEIRGTVYEVYKIDIVVPGRVGLFLRPISGGGNEIII